MADDVVTVNVKGLDELQKALEAEADKAGTSIVRAAVRAGANVVRDEAVKQAPKETGMLAEHFDVKTKKVSGEARAVSAYVGPNGKEVLYSRTNGKTAGLKRTAAFITKLLEFSDKNRNPFFTRAWEASKQRALERIISTLREKLFS